jgi:hypothetical protein
MFSEGTYTIANAATGITQGNEQLFTSGTGYITTTKSLELNSEGLEKVNNKDGSV